MGEMVQLEPIRFTLLEFFQNGDKLLLTSVNSENLGNLINKQKQELD